MTTPEIDQVKAEGLIEHINTLGGGLRALPYWDRGPFCCRILLTPSDDEYAASLFVFVEDSEDYRILSEQTLTGMVNAKRGWRWRGVLGGDSISDDLLEVSFEFLERDWLGEDHLTVAKRVRALARVLAHHTTVSS